MKWYHKSIYCEKLLSWVSLGTSLQEPQGLQPQTLTSWLPSIWNLTRVLSPLRLLCLPYRRLYLGMQQICVCFSTPSPAFFWNLEKAKLSRWEFNSHVFKHISEWVFSDLSKCWLVVGINWGRSWLLFWGSAFRYNFTGCWVLFESFQVILVRSNGKKHWLKPSGDFQGKHKWIWIQGKSLSSLQTVSMHFTDIILVKMLGPASKCNMQSHWESEIDFLNSPQGFSIPGFRSWGIFFSLATYPHLSHL